MIERTCSDIIFGCLADPLRLGLRRRAFTVKRHRIPLAGLQVERVQLVGHLAADLFIGFFYVLEYEVIRK